jgi:hypothetical protein
MFSRCVFFKQRDRLIFERVHLRNAPECDVRAALRSAGLRRAVAASAAQVGGPRPRFRFPLSAFRFPPGPHQQRFVPV